MLLPDGGLETRQDEPETETRAATTTAAYAGPVRQRPILDRLFGPDIMRALGVRMDSRTGRAGRMAANHRGRSPDDESRNDGRRRRGNGNVPTETLKPKRLTGKYEYTHEMAAQVLGLEPALRRDLAAAVKAKMNDRVP